MKGVQGGYGFLICVSIFEPEKSPYSPTKAPLKGKVALRSSWNSSGYWRPTFVAALQPTVTDKSVFGEEVWIFE
jgi:hypothetical protein